MRFWNAVCGSVGPSGLQEPVKRDNDQGLCWFISHFDYYQVRSIMGLYGGGMHTTYVVRGMDVFTLVKVSDLLRK